MSQAGLKWSNFDMSGLNVMTAPWHSSIETAPGHRHYLIKCSRGHQNAAKRSMEPGCHISSADLHRTPVVSNVKMDMECLCRPWYGGDKGGAWPDHQMHLFLGIDVGMEGLLQRHELSPQCVNLTLQTQR